MGCALITHADCLDHLTPDGHPEQVARLDHVLHALQGLDLLRIAAPRCEDRDILRVHPQAYLDRLTGALPGEGLIPLDEDTWLSPRSLEAARRAVGGAVRAVDAVLERKALA